MATQKNSKKETTQKEKKQIKWIQSIRNTIQNEKVQFITGLFCVMIGAYMVLAFSSFALNGGADQSAMEKATTEQADAAAKEIKNATGTSGAHIAHSLVNQGFGISSYSIAIFLIVFGLNLMRIRKFDLKRWGICCATILIWGSLFLSSTIDRWFSKSGIYWGGYHGHNVTAWLEGQFGMPGLFLLLVVTAILFSIYISSNTIEFIRNLFHIKSLLPGKDEEETPQQEEQQATENSNIDFIIEEQPAMEIEWSTQEATSKESDEMEMELVAPKTEEEEDSDCDNESVVTRSSV